MTSTKNHINCNIPGTNKLDVPPTPAATPTSAIIPIFKSYAFYDNYWSSFI